MCTLIVASRVWSGMGLLVAANRDERLARPSAPPRMWADRPVPIIAPVDEAGGGTWLGLNVHGLFVGITNRFGSVPPRKDRRSRGLLVLEALEEADARAAARRVSAHDARTHNRFHLLAADRRSAVLIINDGEQVRELRLATGLHILTERSQGAALGGRERLCAARMQPLLGSSAPPTERQLAAILSIHHDEDPFEGTCVHAAAHDYGTRSSTLIWLHRDSVRFLHAEGPPCQTPYRDYSGLAASVLALA